MRRRDFMTLVGGAAATWPSAAWAQQPALPVVAVVGGGSAAGFTRELAAFRKGLNESGYVEGQNVTIEYHWVEGKYDRLPAMMADLVGRHVTVVATSGSGPAALAAKAATNSIPIVFGLGEDPVQLGLVASLARPGGNATGINFFANEVVAKRLRLFHDLVPKAVRVAVLLNPSNVASTRSTLQGVQASAPAIGLQTSTFNATTPGEIDVAFDTLEREHFDALFVAPDAFFTGRAVQFAILGALHRIPASFAVSEFATAGGLMSYGTDLAEMNSQIALYVGKILKGAKPADLPVLQSSKFDFLLNLQMARALHIEIPPAVQSIADEVIE
jgi:putative tryptophan/tyrosine transport system substrate-binding protein